MHSTRYSNFKRRNKFVEPDVVLVQNAGADDFIDFSDAKISFSFLYVLEFQTYPFDIYLSYMFG